MERISNDKIVSSISDYLNQMNSPKDYNEVALHWVCMHRYLQNEGWKLLKKIVAAVAKGAFDGRNETAKTEASMIYEYMRDMHMV